MGTKKWSEVRRQLVPPDQEQAAQEGAHALRSALGLAQLRSERGLTQVALAEILGKSQGNISEVEHRSDWYLSTLREYIEALGG
ncbi:MAG: transcriptional regulator, partial [Chloroflexota bacterium]